MKNVFILLLFLAGAASSFAAPPKVCVKKNPPTQQTFRDVNDSPGNGALGDCDIVLMCSVAGQKKCQTKDGLTGEEPNGKDMITLWHATIFDDLADYVDLQIGLGNTSGNYTQAYLNPNDNITYIFSASWAIVADGSSETRLTWAPVPVIGG